MEAFHYRITVANQKMEADKDTDALRNRLWSILQFSGPASAANHREWKQLIFIAWYAALCSD